MLVSTSTRAIGMESATTPHKSELRKTPLNALHRRLGAKMVNFGGWDMPVEYPSSGGLIAEHKAVRAGVGVFDVSHMGDIRIRSETRPGGALAAVQHISMNDASKLAIGQAHYSAMLYPEGTFVDDVIVHRLGEDDYLLVINAGTREKDIQWVRENTKSFDCAVEDLSDAYTQLAIQGPRAGELMKELTDAHLDGLKNYWFTYGTVCGLKNTLIARTGYTGEDGFEIYFSYDPATSEKVWNQVMEAGREFAAVPCGLGCRNTLRLESKMALYGHEISDKINVWEAGLRRTLAGFEMIERGIARDGYCCCDEAGNAIGVVTSGSPSPTLGKNIALAYVPPSFSAVGTVLHVEIRGQKCKAQVVPTPFYKRAKKAAVQQVS